MVLLTEARMKEDPSIPSIAETLTTLKKAGIDRIVATTWFNQRNYKDFVSEGRLMDIDRNLADSLTKDAASWIVETVSEGTSVQGNKRQLPILLGTSYNCASFGAERNS